MAVLCEGLNRRLFCEGTAPEGCWRRAERDRSIFVSDAQVVEGTRKGFRKMRR